MFMETRIVERLWRFEDEKEFDIITGTHSYIILLAHSLWSHSKVNCRNLLTHDINCSVLLSQ